LKIKSKSSNYNKPKNLEIKKVKTEPSNCNIQNF